MRCGRAGCAVTLGSGWGRRRVTGLPPASAPSATRWYSSTHPTGSGGLILTAVWLAICACSGAGCAPTTGLEVVLDRKVDREAAQAAVDWLAEETGCSPFELVAGHGGRRDWRGLYPPRGRVTVEVRERLVRRHGANTWGVARDSVRPGARGRIWLDARGRDSAKVIAHELGHVGGLGHRCGTFMEGSDCDSDVGVNITVVVPGFSARMTMDDRQRERLQRLCKEADDGG